MLIANQIVLKRNDRVLMSALSFQLHSGKCFEIIGPNGRGKTSLLKLLSRQEQPFQGSITYLFPDEKPLYLDLCSGFDVIRSLDDNLQYLCALEGYDNTLIYNALSYFHLLPYRKKSFQTLSAGQKKRAHLTRLLLWPRACWLLDEPMNSLDEIGESLVKELCQKHQNQGGSIIAASPKPLGLGQIIPLESYKGKDASHMQKANEEWI